MEPVLEIQGLRLSFGGLQVTNDVSFSLERGSRTALIGPNGAGKTTLINLISGVYRPDSGTVRLLGRDVTRISDIARVRSGLVRSFQITRLFHDLTVLDHVAMAILQRDGGSGGMLKSYHRMPVVAEEAMAVLSGLGLQDLADRTVAHIAYGQQRLLEIAIALSLKPRVLLLDEPGAGVPSTDMDRVMDALEQLPGELAVLLIDHDMDLVRRFARDVIVLAAGSVIFQGSPEALSCDENVRSAYLGEDA